MHKAEFFPADIRLNILAAISVAGFFGWFSADKNSAANPAIGYGWKV